MQIIKSKKKKLKHVDTNETRMLSNNLDLN
jgi:hypothetical protein